MASQRVMILLQVHAYVYKIYMIELEYCEFVEVLELIETAFRMSGGSLWVSTFYQDYKHVTILAVCVHGIFRLAKM